MSRMMKVESVDAYIKNLPAEQRKVLQSVRKIIKETAPKAQEVISYGMPAYKQNGILVYIGAFKGHCSLFPGKGAIIKFEKELKKFRTAKGTIQFTEKNLLPASLVKKIIKERIKDNELKRKKN